MMEDDALYTARMNEEREDHLRRVVDWYGSHCTHLQQVITYLLPLASQSEDFSIHDFARMYESQKRFSH